MDPLAEPLGVRVDRRQLQLQVVVGELDDAKPITPFRGLLDRAVFQMEEQAEGAWILADRSAARGDGLQPIVLPLVVDDDPFQVVARHVGTVDKDGQPREVVVEHLFLDTAADPLADDLVEQPLQRLIALRHEIGSGISGGDEGRRSKQVHRHQQAVEAHPGGTEGGDLRIRRHLAEHHQGREQHRHGDGEHRQGRQGVDQDLEDLPRPDPLHEDQVRELHQLVHQEDERENPHAEHKRPGQLRDDVTIEDLGHGVAGAADAGRNGRPRRALRQVESRSAVAKLPPMLPKDRSPQRHGGHRDSLTSRVQQRVRGRYCNHRQAQMDTDNWWGPHATWPACGQPCSAGVSATPYGWRPVGRFTRSGAAAPLRSRAENLRIRRHRGHNGRRRGAAGTPNHPGATDPRARGTHIPRRICIHVIRPSACIGVRLWFPSLSMVPVSLW